MHTRVLSQNSTQNSRVGFRYPRNDPEKMMALLDARQRGRNRRKAMRKWNSTMTRMKLPVLRKVSSRLPVFTCINLTSGAAPTTTQQPTAQLLCTNLSQEVTDDVLSVLFQQCVPSFQYPNRVRANHFLDQISGATKRASSRLSNPQRCWPTSQDGPNPLRNASAGCSGQREFERVYIEERLGHVRLIHLITSLPWHKSFHYSTLPEYDGRWFTRGEGIHMITARRRLNGVGTPLSGLAFCKDRIIQLVKGSELFHFNEVELGGIGQVDFGSNYFFHCEPRARTGRSVCNSCSGELGDWSAPRCDSEGAPPPSIPRAQI